MITYPTGGGPSGKQYGRSEGRLSLGFALVFSLTIFILGKVGHPAIERTRSVLTEGLVLLAQGLSAPMAWVADASEWTGDVVFVYGENERLREENERLMQWRSVAEALDFENKRLREQLKAPQSPVSVLRRARVVAVQGGPYVRTVLINVGRSEGVREGLVVDTPEGVVGRVIMVGEAASRVLLVTDFNSRVPVFVERSRQNAIAVGRNSRFLDLSFLPVNADVAVGDKILTSGHGGIFPPDLSFGEVVSVDGKNVTLVTAADIGRLEFVRILDYDVAALEPKPETEEGQETPEVEDPDEGEAMESG